MSLRLVFGIVLHGENLRNQIHGTQTNRRSNRNLLPCSSKEPENRLHLRQASQTFLDAVVACVFPNNTVPSSGSKLEMQQVLERGLKRQRKSSNTDYT